MWLPSPIAVIIACDNNVIIVLRAHNDEPRMHSMHRKRAENARFRMSGPPTKPWRLLRCHWWRGAISQWNSVIYIHCLKFIEIYNAYGTIIKEMVNCQFDWIYCSIREVERWTTIDILSIQSLPFNSTFSSQANLMIHLLVVLRQISMGQWNLSSSLRKIENTYLLLSKLIQPKYALVSHRHAVLILNKRDCFMHS